MRFYYLDKTAELQSFQIDEADAYQLMLEMKSAFFDGLGEEIATMWELNFEHTDYLDLDVIHNLTAEQYNQACKILFKLCANRSYFETLQNALTQDQRYLQKEPT